MIYAVKWDTSMFNIKVGCIENESSYNLKSIKDEAIKENFNVVYIRTKKKNEEFIDLFYDEKILYSQILDGNEGELSENIKSFKNKEVSSELIELALQSGLYSRYKLDTNFPEGTFNKLYKTWIVNSVNTDFATDVLVYYKDGKCAGLLTYNIKDDRSAIGILAVSDKYRKLGIGTKLFRHYLASLPKNIKYLDVVTQGCNKAACAFYEKNKFKVSDITYVYHLWLNRK